MISNFTCMQLTTMHLIEDHHVLELILGIDKDIVDDHLLILENCNEVNISM